jgi:6,7-dimethyl-8-ribityllumazine synthase
MSQPQPPSFAAPRAVQTARYAFIQSTWHRDIVDRGRDAFLAEMARQQVPRTAIDLFEVPGALEIPLHVKKLARGGRYAAVVACGLVVDGGIYRHEFVADAVIRALMDIQLAAEVPVISAVLTPQHYHEHADHQAFFGAHFVTKGTEAASACLATVKSLQRLEELPLAA